MDTPFGHIVYFDGICILCQRSVKYLLKIDRHGLLKFASLQSRHAMQNKPLQELVNGKIDTIVYERQGNFYTKSDAVLKLLIDLNHFRTISKLAMYIPPVLRNGIYTLIAK